MSSVRSRVSRRQALKSIAASVTLGGMSIEAAQHVHQHAAEAKKKAAGVYKPQLFNAHEYQTIGKLSEIIIPADEVSGSALDAGAPEFIDIIANHNDEIATILLGGLSWLDRQMERKHGETFLAATPQQQTAMLDVIAYRKNATGGNAAGVRFFDWMRRLSADAFYTSPIGVKDVGYLGNKGMAVFQVPASAIDYAVKRSGL
jgi:gluconate 2-dehydrogenase gamma chain